jgi:hypothetical protein
MIEVTVCTNIQKQQLVTRLGPSTMLMLWHLCFVHRIDCVMIAATVTSKVFAVSTTQSNAYCAQATMLHAYSTCTQCSLCMHNVHTNYYCNTAQSNHKSLHAVCTALQCVCSHAGMCSASTSIVLLQRATNKHL